VGVGVVVFVGWGVCVAVGSRRCVGDAEAVAEMVRPGIFLDELQADTRMPVQKIANI